MYRNLALINGTILAIMIFLNGMLSNMLGPYLSTLVFHVLGFILIFIISIAKKNELNLRKIQFVFYLPGILSVVTILLNNISIPQIGLTVTIGMTLFGQLVMSNLIDQFGLFGLPINKFKREKSLGYLIILAGIIIMSTM